MMGWESFLKYGPYLISAMVILFTYYFLKNRGLPPGPFRWPYIAAISNDKKLMIFLRNLERKYGSIFRFRVGAHHVTVVGGLENIKQVLEQGSLQPYRHWSTYITPSQPSQGSSLGNAELWRIFEKLTEETVDNFLKEKSSIEMTILEEIRFLHSELSAEKCRQFSMLTIITEAVYNIVSAITIGERLEFDRPSCRRFKECLQEISKSGNFGIPENGFSVLQLLSSNKVSKCRDSVKYVQEFLEPRLTNHKTSLIKKELPDFVDVCLKYNATEGKVVNDEGILQGVINLFVSGCEPTVSVVMWTFLMLIRYPELQKKCRHVIKLQIRDDGCVSWGDREKLPFILATIQEAQRFSNPVPYGYPYEVSSESEVGGYRVPSGDLLLLNLRSCHMDYTYWKRPSEFRPENFTDSDGKLIRHEGFLPYGLGHRMTKFNSFMDQILFLIIANIINKFDLRAPEDNPNPSLTAEDGLIRYPKPYQVVPYPTKEGD
ncbi:cytochrome P450 2U1-like [Saccostrea echinata]|uniref:cytochrome P450 2U1-like n=1 Tax=Saccostrea echinata TaxID=191078 RepID=UPI002A8353FC|nr:cytochrome P450 2U1-like [Saccostrea echinata]